MGVEVLEAGPVKTYTWYGANYVAHLMCKEMLGIDNSFYTSNSFEYIEKHTANVPDVYGTYSCDWYQVMWGTNGGPYCWQVDLEYRGGNPFDKGSWNLLNIIKR